MLNPFSAVIGPLACNYKYVAISELFYKRFRVSEIILIDEFV